MTRPDHGGLRTGRRAAHPATAPKRQPKTGLQFRPVLAHKVRDGQKTQTRRIVKPGETEYRLKAGDQNVAVQPGRGKKAQARVSIVAVRQEKLGDLTYEDARAEGFRDRDEFFAYWRELHGLAIPDVQLVVLERLAVSDPAPAAVFQRGETDAELRARLAALRRGGYARQENGLWTITDEGADYLDDPRSSVNTEQLVWVITFRLMQDAGLAPPKLLARSGLAGRDDPDGELRGHTPFPSQAVDDAGEVMDEPDKRWAQATRRDHDEALLHTLEDRLERARARANARGLDISRAERIIASKSGEARSAWVERLERTVEREAPKTGSAQF